MEKPPFIVEDGGAPFDPAAAVKDINAAMTRDEPDYAERPPAIRRRRMAMSLCPICVGIAGRRCDFCHGKGVMEVEVMNLEGEFDPPIGT